MKNDLAEIEAILLSQVDIDFLPLNDVVREFCGFDGESPSDQEFETILSFICDFVVRNNLKCLLGPDMREIAMSEAIIFMKQRWYLKKYAEIDYAIWFDRRSGQDVG